MTFKRTARGALLTGAAALGLTLASPRPAEALTIVPHYATTGAGVLTAAQQAVIASAISFYQATFTDAVTVDIGFFNMSSGLGQSLTLIYTGPTVASMSAALTADQTTADDATAVASLGTAPLAGGTAMAVSSANGRALGLATVSVAGIIGQTSNCNINGIGAVAIDSCIGINTSLTTTSPPAAGLYSMLSVVEHEIDEALGLGSGLSGTTAGTRHLEDLFRWVSAGVRSYVAGACNGNNIGPVANFSIDGGTTALASFNNCNNGGDYGDWALPSTGLVQDAFGTAGANAFLTANSVEARALDVIGWNKAAQVNTVPEPSALPLLATGLTGLAAFGRRRKNRKS